MTRRAPAIVFASVLLAPGCALSHEISVDANVDAGDAARVLAPCRAGEAGTGRDCGWDDRGTVPCRPGAVVSIGCGAECGLGACSGDAVLRVCDGVPCTAARALAADDDSCGSLCSLVRAVSCPASGQLRVLTGSFSAGNGYTCSFVAR